MIYHKALDILDLVALMTIKDLLTILQIKK